jgi:hypothetical protein
VATDPNYQGLTEEELLDQLKDERARMAAVDEKTFKMTLALTLGLTVLGTVSPFLLDRISSVSLRAFCGGLFALSVFYSLAGGFVALGAMRTFPVFGLRRGGIPKERSGARREQLANDLTRNELLAVTKHLRNEAAYMALRNAFGSLFVALTTFVIWLVVQAALALWPTPAFPDRIRGLPDGCCIWTEAPASRHSTSNREHATQSPFRWPVYPFRSTA